MSGLQYGIKEVLDLVIRDFTTKKPITIIDYAMASSNENTAERVDLRGGKGLPVLLSFDHSKTSTFTLTLPLVDLNMLALLAGSELINNTTRELLKTEKITAVFDDDNKLIAKLSKTPINNKVELFAIAGERDFGEEIAGAETDGMTVDLSGISAEIQEGDQLWAIYQYAAPKGAKQIKISSSNFPKAVSMDGFGLWRNQITEEDVPVHVQIHKARPQGEFTFTMEGENATSLELTFDIYEATVDGEKTYIDYIVLDDVEEEEVSIP